MPYIYKITNNINQKVYIGKTSRSIEERWKEHCKQYNQETFCKRPLYAAMKKYGIDYFSIEILEECSNEALSEREEFWIMVFNSYANGYNATKGGDGRPTVNYDLIYNLYNQGKTINEIATLTNYSIPTIKNTLTRQGIVIQKRKAIGPKLYGSLNGKSKAVVMLDKNTEEELQVFESANLAQAFLGGKGNGHISAVCQGKRKTAYGYKWKYLVNK